MTIQSTHPEDIKAALRKKYGTLVAFERAKELPSNSARDVLRGKTVAKTAVAIADELETSVHVLFPGRFLSLKRDDNTTDGTVHRLNAGAR